MYLIYRRNLGCARLFRVKFSIQSVAYRLVLGF